MNMSAAAGGGMYCHAPFALLSTYLCCYSFIYYKCTCPTSFFLLSFCIVDPGMTALFLLLSGFRVEGAVNDSVKDLYSFISPNNSLRSFFFEVVTAS